MPFKPGGEMTGRLRFVLALVLAVALFPLLLIAMAQTWSEAREEQRDAEKDKDDSEGHRPRGRGVEVAVADRGQRDQGKPHPTADSRQGWFRERFLIAVPFSKPNQGSNDGEHTDQDEDR